MDRQTLRDWVIRYNAHGPDGLHDCWGDGRPPRLEPQEQAEPSPDEGPTVRTAKAKLCSHSPHIKKMRGGWPCLGSDISYSRL